MEATPRRGNRTLRWLGLAAATAGIAVGATSIANAATKEQTPSPTTAASGSTTAPAAPATAPGAPADRPDVDPATLPNGPGETLLTGDTASKVTAAALAAEPGATIIRVETDADGSPYEAHITKADGTRATLKFDASFNVTSTEAGFGGPGGGRHGHGPGQDDPAATGGSAGSATTTG